MPVIDAIYGPASVIQPSRLVGRLIGGLGRPWHICDKQQGPKCQRQGPGVLIQVAGSLELKQPGVHAAAFHQLVVEPHSVIVALSSTQIRSAFRTV